MHFHFAHKLLPVTLVKSRVTDLQRLRRAGRYIALETGVSAATVSRILKREGQIWINGARIRDIEPAAPVIRGESKEPGGLICREIERLVGLIAPGTASPITALARATRGVGWDRTHTTMGSRIMARVHICIDDHSRIADTDIFPNQQAISAVACCKGGSGPPTQPHHHRPSGDDPFLAIASNRLRGNRRWVVLQILCLRRNLQGSEPQTYPHKTLHPRN